MLPLYYYNTKYTYHFASRNEWKIETLIAVFWVQLAKIIFFLCWILLVHTYTVVGQLFWNKCLSFSSKFPSLSSEIFQTDPKKRQIPKSDLTQLCYLEEIILSIETYLRIRIVNKKNHEALRKTPNSNTERRRLKRGWKIGNDS